MVNSPKPVRRNTQNDSPKPSPKTRNLREQNLVDKAAGVIQAVQAGETPTNEQITQTIDAAKQTISNQPSTSKYGRRAAEDVQEVLGQAQKLLEEKNRGDLFQQLVQHVREAAEEAKAEAEALKDKADSVQTDVGRIASEGKENVQSKARDIGESLKSLAFTLADSSEFRMLLINLVELLQGVVEQTSARIQAHEPGRVLDPLADVAVDATELAKQKVQQAKELGGRVGEEAQQIGEQAWQLGERVGERVGEDVQEVGRRAGDAWENLDMNTPSGDQSFGDFQGYSSSSPSLSNLDAQPPSSRFGLEGQAGLPGSAEYSGLEGQSGLDPAWPRSYSTGSGVSTRSRSESTGAGMYRTQPIVENLNQLADAAEETGLQAGEEAREIGRDVQDTAREASREARQIGREVQGAVQEAGKEAVQLGRNLQGAVNEASKRAQQLGREVVQDFREGGLPIDEQKRREVVDRFFSLWDQAIQNPEFGKAITAIFDIMEESQTRLQQLIEYAKAQASGVELPKMKSADLIWTDMHEIIARWTGRKELDQFITDCNEYVSAIQNDGQMNQLFDDIRSYVNETIENPKLLQEEDQQQRASELFDRLYNQFSRWQQHDETQYLLNELRSLLDTIRTDETTLKLNAAAEKLGRDLVFDEKGRLSFKVTQEVLDSMRQLILPLFLDQFSFVPLPRIETSDAEYDITIDHLVFPGSMVLPEHLDLKAKEHLSVATKSDEQSKATASVVLTVTAMQAELKNVHFSFRKKTGIKMSDRGSANITFGGPNSKIAIKWTVVTTADSIQFETQKVHVRLDKFDIHINEAKHDVLLPIVTTLFNGTIKHRLEKQIAETLLLQLNNVNRSLNQLVVDAASKKRELTHRAEKAFDKATDKAHKLAGQAQKQMEGLQDKAAHQLSDMASNVRAAFQPGNGETLKQRAKDALSSLQQKIDSAKEYASPYSHSSAKGSGYSSYGSGYHSFRGTEGWGRKASDSDAGEWSESGWRSSAGTGSRPREQYGADIPAPTDIQTSSFGSASGSSDIGPSYTRASDSSIRSPGWTFGESRTVAEPISDSSYKEGEYEGTGFGSTSGTGEFVTRGSSVADYGASEPSVLIRDSDSRYDESDVQKEWPEDASHTIKYSESPFSRGVYDLKNEDLSSEKGRASPATDDTLTQHTSAF